MTTFGYIHPADPNLNSVQKSMQYSWDGKPLVRTFINNDVANPIPVSLGGNDVVITGNVTIPGTVNVTSSPSDPVHVHVSEVGTSGILTVPWMPINGNVYIDGGNVNVVVRSGNVTVQQGTSPWLIVGNVNAAVSGNVVLAPGSGGGSLQYGLSIQQLLVPGHTGLNRSGYNPDMPQNVLTSIWVQGGVYPWSSWTSAQTLYVISSDPADTGQSIYITGLDNAYAEQSETIVTNGITAVPTVKTYRRITRAWITSSGNFGPTSNITFRLTSGVGTVVANMGPNIGATKLSQYTVPAGKTAYMTSFAANSFRTGSGNIGTAFFIYVRRLGEQFIAETLGEVVNGNYAFKWDTPLVIPEKSDIDIQAIADGNNTNMSVNYNLILIDN